MLILAALYMLLMIYLRERVCYQRDLSAGFYFAFHPFRSLVVKIMLPVREPVEKQQLSASVAVVAIGLAVSSASCPDGYSLD